MAHVLAHVGQHLDAFHLTSAISRLAGFALYKRLPEDMMEERVRAPARTAAGLLLPRLQNLDGDVLSRALYGLSRLGVHDTQLLEASMELSLSLMSTCRDVQSFSALIATFAAADQRPPQRWIDKFCMEVYTRMSALSPQNLAHVLAALAHFRHAPSAVWLDAAMRQFRAGFGRGCHATSLVRFAVALAALRAAPTFNWLVSLTVECRDKVDRLRPNELCALLWAMVQLGHKPDLIYLELWCKAVARRMDRLDEASLLLAMAALAVAGTSPLPGRFVSALLQRSSDMLPHMSLDAAAALLCSMVALRVRPDEDWMELMLQETEERLQGASAVALCDLLWSLGRLQYQPDEVWCAALYPALEAALPAATAPQLGQALWALRRLGLAEPPAWRARFDSLAAERYGAGAAAELRGVLDGTAAAPVLVA